MNMPRSVPHRLTSFSPIVRNVLKPSLRCPNKGTEVRETLKGQELSFTEIAKVVGERWQVLDADAREACERQANSAKEKYYAELAEYKKTPEYEAYQKYLEDFKAKHAAPPKGKYSRSMHRPIVTFGDRGRRQTFED